MRRRETKPPSTSFADLLCRLLPIFCSTSHAPSSHACIHSKDGKRGPLCAGVINRAKRFGGCAKEDTLDAALRETAWYNRSGTSPAALAARYDPASDAAFKSVLVPHFRAMHNKAVVNMAARKPLIGAPERSTQLNIAVLVSGGVRTMLHTDAVADARSFFAWLKQRRHVGSVKVFAFLEPDDVRAMSHMGRRQERHALTGDEVRRRRRRRGGEREEFLLMMAPNETDRALKRAQMETALRQWAVPFELEVNRPVGGSRGFAKLRHHLHPDVWQACGDAQGSLTTSRSGHIFMGAKHEAATNMMKRAEAQHGAATFDVVIRLRPDLCHMRARPFFDYALERLKAGWAMPMFIHDGAAVLPRWAADALAAAWRGSEHCALPAWAGSTSMDAPQGGAVAPPSLTPGCLGLFSLSKGKLGKYNYQQRFLLLAAGIVSVELSAIFAPEQPAKSKGGGGVLGVDNLRRWGGGDDGKAGGRGTRCVSFH